MNNTHWHSLSHKEKLVCQTEKISDVGKGDDETVMGEGDQRSPLRREWDDYQAREAGRWSRGLLIAALLVFVLIPGMGGKLMSGLFLLLATALVALQYVKGDRMAARTNGLFAWIVLPLIAVLWHLVSGRLG